MESYKLGREELVRSIMAMDRHGDHSFVSSLGQRVAELQLNKAAAIHALISCKKIHGMMSHFKLASTCALKLPCSA